MGADVRDDFRGGGGVFGADVRGQTFMHSPLTPETLARLMSRNPMHPTAIRCQDWPWLTGRPEARAA